MWGFVGAVVCLTVPFFPFSECEEVSPFYMVADLAFTLALFAVMDRLIYGWWIPPRPSTVHLPTAKRITVWALWMFFAVTLTTVYAMDFAAGLVTCPRPLGLQVLVWSSAVAATLGSFMAEPQQERPA